jgi:DNA-3-methyladenine glycosylase
MRLGRPLARSFFGRPCLEVARDLVGCLLVRVRDDGDRLVGRLVEVEAYLGDGSDPASHSHRGPTPRNRSMFGAPGRIYTYRSYGIHICVNLVCEPEGSGAAVLLRALEPLEGKAAMRASRGLSPDQAERAIAAGPGRLAQAMDLDLSHDGMSAVRGALTVRPAPGAPNGRVSCGPRIGISRAADLPYRFYLESSPWLSRR